MAKLTFSLDPETVQLLRAVSERRRKPQSLVVREAIAEYAARDEKLTDAERARKLEVLATLASLPSTRGQASVDRELREVRRARRAGWRRPSD
ncbi:MAG TPA: ribbon-helix-helix domain-containing protein [Vicinamibacterales bacterium]|nr:ribbon-helix-helix domain-containing protein [Vicinamibacterales bacterium]